MSRIGALTPDLPSWGNHLVTIVDRRPGVEDTLRIDTFFDIAVNPIRNKSTVVLDPSEALDRETLKEIGRGDVDAFARLFDRHSATSMDVALRIIGRRSLAEEAVHTTFLAVWHEPQMPRGERGTVRAWLLSRVRHHALHPVRGEGTSKPTATHDMPLELWQIVELMYFGGLSQTSIAGLLSLPLPTVRSRTLLAMHLLRTVLGGPSR